VKAVPAGPDGEPGSDPVLIVLALNSGSSSLKFDLYRVGRGGADRLLGGEADALGSPQGRIWARDGAGTTLLTETGSIDGHAEAVGRVARLLEASPLPAPQAVGHRIVHGGPHLRAHCVIDDSVLRQLEAAAHFAPLHTPAALSVIRFSQRHFPGLAQVACFDTAFHASLPPIASVLPIPRSFRAEGVQRYGFHGLSCESIVRQLAADLPGRLVIAHLGNGASITAVREGRSVDTSMGLTPAGGVMMGTRSGDLDPGVLLHLMRVNRLDADALEDLLNHRSGLLGVSGVDSDMRRLHEAAASNADARLAIDMFCQGVRKQLAAMIAVLGGADLVVFTGGIGENDAAVRAAACEGLACMGVAAEPGNGAGARAAVQGAPLRGSVRVLDQRAET
jgi:acetate kinase